jgi:hypothetical protein
MVKIHNLIECYRLHGAPTPGLESSACARP